MCSRFERCMKDRLELTPRHVKSLQLNVAIAIKREYKVGGLRERVRDYLYWDPLV